MRQFPEAQLMHDLAGFGITVVIPLGRLELAENFERRGRKLRIDRGALVGGNQAVAPEQRHEPGHAPSGHVLHVISTLDRQA